jgi:hypothetical protein
MYNNHESNSPVWAGRPAQKEVIHGSSRASTPLRRHRVWCVDRPRRRAPIWYRRAFLPHASGESASFPTSVNNVGSSSLLVTTGDARFGLLEPGDRIVVTIRPCLATSAAPSGSCDGVHCLVWPLADDWTHRIRSGLPHSLIHLPSMRDQRRRWKRHRGCATAEARESQPTMAAHPAAKVAWSPRVRRYPGHRG